MSIGRVLDSISHTSDLASAYTKMAHLDIYRRQARNLAWYDQDGEPSSHNPFKKFRSRPQRTNSIQLESQLQSRSVGDLNLSEDQRRRHELNGGLGGPEYAPTFPPGTASSDQFTAASAERNAPEPSIASQNPINVSTTRGLDTGAEDEPKPRKRKGLLGRLGRHSTNEEDPKDSKSMMEAPKFTLASQLRATILNSWINVLIVAAPVGSMV